MNHSFTGLVHVEYIYSPNMGTRAPVVHSVFCSIVHFSCTKCMHFEVFPLFLCKYL